MLIVTDVVMPKMRGTQLAQEIWESHPDQKIVFMTGYPEEELGEIDFSHERATFIGKPFTGEDIVTLVNQLVSTTGDSRQALTRAGEG